MKYKLLATDMDGTLLDDCSQITERTKDALLSIVNAGIIFVVSTGRPMCGVENINMLFSKDLPFVIFNGAMVVMGKSREVLFSKLLSFENVKEIYDMGISREVSVVLWTKDELFVSRHCEATKEYQKISGADIHIIDNINELREQDICKMIWIDKPEKVAQYQDEMNKYFSGKVNCHTSRTNFLEFVDIGASKALALESIGNSYGIDKSEMIAIGDGYNDVSMLEYAGLGVAMANAPDDIKKICQHVTLSNNHDGVAAVIYKYIL